jgi:hypothetical protein
VLLLLLLMFHLVRGVHQLTGYSASTAQQQDLLLLLVLPVLLPLLLMFHLVRGAASADWFFSVLCSAAGSAASASVACAAAAAADVPPGEGDCAECGWSTAGHHCSPSIPLRGPLQ